MGQLGAVEEGRLVRRGEDDDAGVRRESVHLDEQRVERLRVDLR